MAKGKRSLSKEFTVRHCFPVSHGYKIIINCDMIKGNVSDVGNIDFELQAKRGDKFLSFTLFLNLKELFITLQPDVRLK